LEMDDHTAGQFPPPPSLRVNANKLVTAEISEKEKAVTVEAKRRIPENRILKKTKSKLHWE
jgi:hypothetical protein